MVPRAQLYILGYTLIVMLTFWSWEHQKLQQNKVYLDYKVRHSFTFINGI